MRSNMMIGEYIQAQKDNLTKLSAWEPFRKLFPPVDELYVSAIELVPSGPPPIFGQILLICHKSFLSAAALIGQAQPEDAGAITRRAIEAATFGAASKTNPKQAKEWIESRERLQRWADRLEGKKPKNLNRKPFEIDPNIEPTIDQLKGHLAALSDSTVHFTPEFLSTLAWDNRVASMYLNYFTKEQSELQRVIVFTSATHLIILQVMDWCFDGRFQSDSGWQTLLGRVANEGLRWQGTPK